MPSENVADVEAILQRVIWALKLTPDEWKTYINANRMDVFHSIPHPKNDGMLMIGRVGTERFQSVADRYLKANPQRKVRANRTAFIEKLRSSFTTVFLKELRNVDDGNVGKWVTDAYEASEQDHETLTHYIPCGLFHTQTVKRFDLGPVTFLHADEFFTSHKEEFEKLNERFADRHRAQVADAIKKGFPAKDAATQEQSKQWGDHVANGLLRSFGDYNWFARVTVPHCEAEVSYGRALFAVRGALNIIKLLLGSRHTYRLRTAEDQGLPGNAATLSRCADGELRVSLSTNPVDNTIGDEWLDILTNGTGGFYAACGRILTHVFGFDRPPHLCARFMDALYWYGDAIAERSPPAKIVKFVNAIERICNTGKERGVTDIVVTRAAILYAGSSIPFAEAEKLLSEIYTCRSDLVHGSLSPFDDRVRAEVVRTHDATQQILLAGLDYFHAWGLENPKFTKNDLKRCYRELERFHRPQPPPATATPDQSSSAS